MAIEESSLKTTSSSSYQKQASSMKLANLNDMFKKAYKGVCKSTIVVSSDTLSLAPTILAIKTPQHMEENSNNPEPADEEDTQMEYSSD